MIRLITYLILFSFSSTIYPCGSDLTYPGPATVCIQWFDTPSAMDQADGDASTSFNDYGGGAATQLTSPGAVDMYLEVMCNRLEGYDVIITALNSGASSTQGNLDNSGQTITYTANLSVYSGMNGATPSLNLDLTGSSSSISVVFTELQLPLIINTPNIYRLRVSVPNISSVSDGLIVSGNYSGGFNATAIVN
ncbi:MAG: hypothetical protein CMO81_12300 [Waddliaceae bacterium]|nr:hypothetical protein [Waddliaceae bacterium]